MYNTYCEIIVALFYLLQSSNVEVTKGKGSMSLNHYFFGNAQVVSTCENAKNKVTSDVGEFKTDGINLKNLHISHI